MPRYRRFSDASISEKILDSMLLLAIATGYLFASLYLYFTHQGLDGQPGLSVEDVRIAYYGKHQQTRLGAAISGPMAGNLPNPEAGTTINEWIEQGATEPLYEKNVKPILDNYCIMCHSEAAGMGLPPLTSYNKVKELTRMDTGASIQSLVRVSHIHLFGISFILFLVGRIFILCEMPVLIKRIMVAIPFVAMAADIFSWFITKVYPEFAVVVVIAGALMGISFMMQIAISLYQMWIYKPKVVPIEM